MQWREIGLERSLVGEVGVIAEEHAVMYPACECGRFDRWS
jgi:hypothetical protein